MEPCCALSLPASAVNSDTRPADHCLVRKYHYLFSSLMFRLADAAEAVCLFSLTAGGDVPARLAGELVSGNCWTAANSIWSGSEHC